MKKISFPFLMISFIAITAGCRKDVVNNLDGNEGIVYITEHDNTINFSNYQSFKIADSVSVVKDGRLVRRDNTAYDASLVAAISQIMVQRGFQLETDQAKTPDLGINISRITTDYTGVVSYDDYWGGYGNYWDPYYWGYGGYGYYFPYSFGIYTFREGALSVDMIDLKNPDTSTNKLKTVWSGLARGSGIFNTANVTEVVQSLFNQSAYLRR
jgi:hypothetical protein